MTVLTAAMRVKNEAHNLPRCLANLERFCDHIVAYDDGSTDDTAAILKAHPKVRHVVTMNKGYYHEGMDMTAVLTLAALTNPDWLVRVDADEIFEERAVQHVRRLLAMPDFKAWSLHRFNFVDSEREGDSAEHHWCLFRFTPGNVFYWNLRAHAEVPNVDRIPGKWGLANLRVKHFGYVKRAAKEATAKGQGYFFGDLLTPSYEWDDAPDAPLVYTEMERPFYYFWSDEQVEHFDFTPSLGRQRYPQRDEAERWVQKGWTQLQNLSPVEAAQALAKARLLLTARPNAALGCRLALYEALLHYHNGRWDEAERALLAVRAKLVNIWPFGVASVDYHLAQIPVLRSVDTTGFWNPRIFNYHALRERYLSWFFQELRRRQPPGLYLYGMGRHTYTLDAMGFFHHFNVEGIVDDHPEQCATVRGLPVMTLAEAKARGARTLMISTDYFEPALLPRLRQEDLGPMKLQPVYYTFGDQPFWFDQRP